MTATEQYLIVPLADLRESPLNPRKTFNAGALQELAESIKAKGIITPLITRPAAGGGYELAAGHRRRRASELAGLTEVPIVVRSMSDEDFLEVLTIENLQREDVHPLEEADGYRVLIDTWRKTRADRGGREASREDVERVAHRVGKSVSYVYQRLKLLELKPTVRKAFEEGRMTAGHAIHIARLPAPVQQQVVDNEFRGDGAYQVSVRRLAETIGMQYHCNLSSAPFKAAEASLVSSAGACTTCPKLAGNNPLYEGLAKTICTDKTCFSSKLVAYAERQVVRLHAAGKAVVKISSEYGGTKKEGVLGENKFSRVWEHNPCPSAVTGVWVDGRDAGKSIPVCIDSKCPQHGGGSSRGISGSAEEAARRKKAKVETARRRAIFGAVLPKIARGVEVQGLPPREVMNLVALGFWSHVYGEHQALVAGLLGWEKTRNLSTERVAELPDAALWTLIISLAVATDLTAGTWNNGKPSSLNALAEAYGVDVAAIDRDQQAARSKAAKPRPKPAASVQPSAPNRANRRK
jgi:ParB/RepB/Spo0J family partition protein